MQCIRYMCGQLTVSDYVTVVKKDYHFMTIILRFDRAQILPILEVH